MSDHLSDTWMWERAQELLDQADRLHRQFFQLGSPGERGAIWTPPVDIYETEREYLVVAALPGVAEKDIELTVDRNVIVVSGERRIPEPCRGSAVRRMEIPHGRFQRRVELGEAVRLLESRTADGCLFVKLEKTGEAAR